MRSPWAESDDMVEPKQTSGGGEADELAGYSCYLVSRVPVVVRRRVKWGECDPAGVVYTPRFADFVAEAFHLFLGAILEGSLQHRFRELDVGTPARALTFDFRRSLWPDQVFDMTIRVSEFKTRTFTLEIRAHDTQPGDIFVATLTAICVHYSRRESRPIPEELLSRLSAYRVACG